MLLTDARRAARTGPDEELIPLDKQNRTLWDRAEISEGIELLTAALSKGSVGLYQLLAAIAAVLWMFSIAALNRRQASGSQLRSHR